MNTQSAATRRASDYPAGQSEWYCGFSYLPVTGIGYEEGIHRRDPSSVIQLGDLHYVYYTRSAGPYFGRSQIGNPRSKLFPWDYAGIYCATSKDGVNWVEQGPAARIAAPSASRTHWKGSAGACVTWTNAAAPGTTSFGSTAIRGSATCTRTARLRPTHRASSDTAMRHHAIATGPAGSIPCPSPRHSL